MRFWEKIDDDKPRVEMLCADERLCDDMKTTCHEESAAKKSYECIVTCCHDDACNSDSAGTSVNFSLCLVILCIAVGVIEALNLT